MTTTALDDALRTRVMRPALRPRPGVIGTQAGDTTVLLDVNTGTYHTLNEVGGRIWQLLVAGESLTAIVLKLSEEYDVTCEQLVHDVLAMVDRLQQTELVVEERAP